MQNSCGWFPWVVAAIGFLHSAEASAQVSTMPSPIVSNVPTSLEITKLDELTGYYNAGRWDELQTLARELLDNAKATLEPLRQTLENARTAREKEATNNPGKVVSEAEKAKTELEAKLERGFKKATEVLDWKRNYIQLTWIGTDPQGKTLLPRVVVHEPPGEPFAVDLPGVGVAGTDAAVVEVFLSRGTRAKIVSVYTSTREKDPLQEQLPAFVTAIANPLFGAFGTFAGSAQVSRTGVAPPAPPPTQTPPVPTIAVAVGRVGLPHKRASINWKAVAKEPVALQSFVDDSVTFAEELRYAGVPNETCARKLIDVLAGKRTLTTASGVVQTTAIDPVCAGDTGNVANCKAKFDAAFQNAFEATVSSCSGITKEQRSAVEQVDKKFREFVATNLMTGADANITFKNRPETRWSFGAGTGVLVAPKLSNPRVKLDDGAIVGDPLPRVVTMAFANWTPWGYDAELPSPSPGERFKLLVGATLTPDFGVTAGGTFLLARGIGLTAAGVLMFSRGPGSNAIGHPPATPEDPFEITYAKGVVLGISYNFK